MTPEVFCGWLQGYLQAKGVNHGTPLCQSDALDVLEMVKAINHQLDQRAQERHPTAWVEGRPLDWHKAKAGAGAAADGQKRDKDGWVTC